MPVNFGKMPNARNEARVRSPRNSAVSFSVNAPSTYFFWPAGPARRVVSSNPATAAAVISALISLTTSAITSAALARHEWMNPSETWAPATSAISLRHLSTGTCWNTSRYTARARRAGPMLTGESGTPGGRAGDVHLLVGAGHAPVFGPGQVRTAPARPGRVMIDDLVRHRPRHGRPGRAGLLAALARRPL